MGNLLSYSGISTKIRAMQSKLTSEEQILEILELSSVPQVAAYLKKTPEYSEIWASLDETTRCHDHVKNDKDQKHDSVIIKQWLLW